MLQLDSYNTCVGTVCAPNFTPTRNTGRPSTVSYSAYGDVTYRFFEGTRLTLGLRYTDETKRLSGLVMPLAGFPNSVAALTPACSATQGAPCTVYSPGDYYIGNPAGIPTSLHFGKLTYRVVLAQDIGENIHAYVSHNLGFKSGAFNGNVFTNPPARPELLFATEVGVKSELFDKRMRLNVAYFHYNYQDVQVRSQAPPALPGIPILLNVGRERIDGIDADFSLAPFNGLVINGSFEYLDAKYTDYPGTTCATPGTRVVGGVTLGTVTSVACNLAGYPVIQAPPYSASIGFVYTAETNIGTFAFSANDHYNSRYAMVPDGNIYQPSHHLVDMSLNWSSPDKHYDVNLFVRNLTKEYVYAVAQASSNFAIVPGAPQTFGATVGVHF